MLLRTLRVELLISIAIFSSFGCAANSSGKTSTGSTSSTQPSSQAATDSSFPLTESDLVAYEKGLTQEIELVQAARERGRNARTPQGRAAAAQEEWDAATIPGGAEAAGLPVERYKKVRKAVNHVLETLNFQGKINGPLEIDQEHASAEMKRRLGNDAFAELSPSSAAALRARMNSIVPIWAKYMGLVAVNG